MTALVVVGIGYAVMSTVTFLAYALDKRAPAAATAALPRLPCTS